MGKKLLPLVVLVLVLVAGWVWAGPREQVPVPGPDATPTQVVQAYVRAVNARDYGTSRAICPGDRDIASRSRFALRHGRMDDLSIISSGSDPANASTQVVHATLTLANGDGTTTALGPIGWSFYLQRTGPDGRWQIHDQGQG